MERFQIQKEGEPEQGCLLCSQEIFRHDNTCGYFCLDCKPRVYICNFCKDIFLESHNIDHLIGMYFKDRETYLDHYKSEIQMTCEKLMFEEKFHDCVRFCQNALSLNLSHEIAIYCLKMGMLCHVNLVEYSEAKVCGKNALKIIEHFKIKDNEDEIEIICKMCHIYLKLENPEKCLRLGTGILDRIETGNLKIEEEFHYEIMYICGRAFKEVGKYERSLKLLQRVLKRSCQMKNFIQGRFALSTILDTYLILNKRDIGLNKLAEYKKFYPLIMQKENDVDVSFIRLKKSINKLRDIPAVDTLDLSNSMDGKIIAFNKQHYLAIIDNDVNTSYMKLIHSIEISEELIITLLKEKEKIREMNEEIEEEDGEHVGESPDSSAKPNEGLDAQQASIDQKLENVIKKRSQLIERVYCCCLLRNRPFEAFQWAERGISYLCFARNLISKNDVLEEEEKQKLLMEKLNIQELLELARAHNIIFIFFTVVNELHYSIGDFVDVWIVKPNAKASQRASQKKKTGSAGGPPMSGTGNTSNPFFRKELVRVRLIHKPLEIVRMILEMYTEVNQVNAFFLNRIRKQKFRDHVDEIKRWQTFVDKLFTSNQRKFTRYNELLEELYTYLIIPIQAYLPKGEIQTMLKQKHSTTDFPRKKLPQTPPQQTTKKKGGFLSRSSRKRKPLPQKKKPVGSPVQRAQSFKYKRDLKEKPPNLVIVPDDFVSFIPFAFLKKSKNEFLVDYFNVSVSHSIKMFYYNIFQLKNGRKMRRMMIHDKMQERLNPFSPHTPPDSPVTPQHLRIRVDDDDDPNDQHLDNIPLNQSPLFVNTVRNDQIPSPITHSPKVMSSLSSHVKRRSGGHSKARAHSIKKIDSPSALDRIGKDAMFGFIMTDSYDEFRKTEILPIHQLFQATIRKNMMDSYCDSLMFSPSKKMKRSLQRIFKEFYDPFLGPKIVHIANRSSCSGKNLPTFQKEMSPNYGIQLMFDVTSNDRRNQTISGNKPNTETHTSSNKVKSEVLLCNEFENIFDFQGTELVVLSHNASIYTNSTFDGLNGIHRSVTNLGCPTILYPLFDVSEFFSTLFLVQFYKHLFGTDTQTKKSKSEAYRHAMISSMEIFPLLRKAPMFLSSFQLMGESMNSFEDDDQVEEEVLNTLNSLHTLKKK